MKVTIQHFDGRVDKLSIPTQEEIKGFMKQVAGVIAYFDPKNAPIFPVDEGKYDSYCPGCHEPYTYPPGCKPGQCSKLETEEAKKDPEPKAPEVEWQGQGGMGPGPINEFSIDPELVPIEEDADEEVDDEVDDAPPPQCFLCGKDIADVEFCQEAYCYGCRTFICEDHPQNPWGRHRPEAHDEP
jgi:hypothetical protein